MQVKICDYYAQNEKEREIREIVTEREKRVERRKHETESDGERGGKK